MPNSYRRNACQRVQRLSQKTLLAYLTEGSKQAEFFAKMTLDEWEVMSFDPKLKQACVRIFKPSGETVITVTLPTMGN